MKTITIGRGEGCDIQIEHNKISRRHAILKVYTFGKMEIVDMGQNGTWVNGIKLRPGVPFPVKRKDVVNFAEVSQLNWSRVPNPTKNLKLGGFAAILLLLLIVAVSISCPNHSFEASDDGYQPSISSEVSPEGNASISISSGTKRPSANSQEQSNDKKKENTDKDKTVMPGSKSGAKSAEELFPFINKTKKDTTKKDTTKKEEGKKKDDDKKTKDKKSDKPSNKKVDLMI